MSRSVRCLSLAVGVDMRRVVPVFSLILFAGLCPDLAFAQDTSTGVVRPEEAVIVRSEVAGIIQTIEVGEGDEVSEGQVLVQMRSNTQEIGVRLTEARLLRAEAAAAASRATLENAQHTLARIDIAAAAVPEKEREDVADEMRRLDALLRAQEAEVAEVRVELGLRQLQLDETRISAPFDGTVTVIQIEKGDTLAPLETPILVLVNLNRLYVELALPVAEISNVQEGRSVEVQVEDAVLGNTGHIEGMVSYVNPTVDPSSRTFLVKIRISDHSRRIRPGMRAVVVLP